MVQCQPTLILLHENTASVGGDAKLSVSGYWFVLAFIYYPGHLMTSCFLQRKIVIRCLDLD